MKHWYALTLLSIGLAPWIPAAEPKKPELPIVWSLDQGWDGPESACYDPTSKALYVSNVGGDPTQKDGEGWISKVSLDGKVLEAKWVYGLNAPKGIACHKGVLYVTDIDDLVAIDIATAKVKRTTRIKDARFLNDVAVIGDHQVYVSDTLAGKIFLVEAAPTPPRGAPAAAKISVVAEGKDLEHPNGLFVETERLLVAGWGTELDPKTFATKTPGRLLALHRTTKAITPITEKPLGNLDGVESDGQGGYLVSDWIAGKVYHVNGGQPTLLLDGLKGAADIGFVADRKLLVVPRMRENKVTAYDLSAVLKAK